MGAITTIVVPDAATTPVNHTFEPVSVDGGSQATWKEMSASSASGYWPLALKFRQPLRGQPEPMYRIQIPLAMPVVVNETVNGVAIPKVARTLRANVEFILPEASLLQERKDLRKILVGILDNALFKDAVENLKPVY